MLLFRSGSIPYELFTRYIDRTRVVNDDEAILAMRASRGGGGFSGNVVGLPVHVVKDSAKVLIVQVRELRDCRGPDGRNVDPCVLL